MRENALALQLNTLLLEAILTGLAMAMATTWSALILACAQEWLSGWSNTLQHLISALFITGLALGFAVLASILLASPKKLIVKCARGAAIACKRAGGMARRRLSMRV